MLEKSDVIKDLATALSKAQAEMHHAKKTEDNPYFKSKYADLSAVIDVIREPLAKNGLSYTQTTSVKDGDVSLVTTVLHTSGEWFSSIYPIRPLKNDPQGYGSAWTYARRYSLASVFGIASDEDDDGNQASKKPGGEGYYAKNTSQKEEVKGRAAIDARQSPGDRSPPLSKKVAQKTKAFDKNNKSHQDFFMKMMEKHDVPFDRIDDVANALHGRPSSELEACVKEALGDRSASVGMDDREMAKESGLPETI